MVHIKTKSFKTVKKKNFSLYLLISNYLQGVLFNGKCVQNKEY